ncbi:hypothetical protein CYMTET_15533 [Cymbomonas tetramitiformis]|uniref:Zinc finger DNA-directed DNA polymerase family B alpha domain-containing protein n=1 Tax=Cymbomonas tetramitiformis TaxID=36881 RepID=A0AAE0GE85_9CHLO|nr:hypothetical protein CYMTET_15533 [Cymbomonas tetramitiformis]
MVASTEDVGMEAVCSMGLMFSEGDLYKQLSHFVRQLDLEAAVHRMATTEEKEAEILERCAPWRLQLKQGLQAAEKICNSSAYKWVRLDSFFSM